MDTYKIIGTKMVRLLNEISKIDIPMDPLNMDYVKFKKEINGESAKLQNIDGNEMTTADAKAYIATLP